LDKGAFVIKGVSVVALKRIADSRGSVMHMLRCDSPFFAGFGEIYFSAINPGCVKAWKKHTQMTQAFAVPVGNVRLVIYDDRPDSPTKGNCDVYDTGADSYTLCRVPPLLWYGFRCLSQEPALIANCADIPHRAGETENAPSDDPRIPYDWNSHE
jgi:dTDP-4-dehydrorhamnose 3,5-epimerase